jgi:hypothetical protein
MKHHRWTALAGALALGLAAGNASAHLISTGPVSLHGTGLGNVDTILELHDTGKGGGEFADHTTEAGDISPLGIDKLPALTGGGRPDDATGKSTLRTFGSLGITKASDFHLVFNPAEPGGDSITLKALRLTVYDGTAPVQIFDLPAAVTFASTDPGVGKAGFGIGISPDELNAFQSVIAPNRTIGLQASLTGFAGGPEGFFVEAVPEPGTITMCIAGLLGVIGLARRRLPR